MNVARPFCVCMHTHEAVGVELARMDEPQQKKRKRVKPNRGADAEPQAAEETITGVRT
jgi:hypothetical protein